MSRRSIVSLIAIIVATFSLAGTAARADDADIANFYRSHALTLGVPNDPGGTYDIYERLLARHLPDHIPGNPTIIVQNVPTAGGIALANLIYSSEPKDGSYIGLVRGTVIQEQAFKDPHVTFDARKFAWLGNINSDFDTCIVWSTSPIHSIADFYKQEVVVGASGAGAQSYSFAVAYRNLLGMKLKIVGGYPGTPERILAMQRGELVGACGISAASLGSGLSDYLKNGKIRVILQAGLHKDPRLKDIPNVLDEAKDARQRSALEFLLLPLDLGRPMAAPPGTPANRVAALRKAFADTMRDPGFIADAKKVGVDIDWSDAKTVEKSVDELLSSPPDAVETVRATMTN